MPRSCFREWGKLPLPHLIEDCLHVLKAWYIQQHTHASSSSLLFLAIFLCVLLTIQSLYNCFVLLCYVYFAVYLCTSKGTQTESTRQQVSGFHFKIYNCLVNHCRSQSRTRKILQLEMFISSSAFYLNHPC